MWVKTGNPQNEQMFSALPPDSGPSVVHHSKFGRSGSDSDIGRCWLNIRFAPKGDMAGRCRHACSRANCRILAELRSSWSAARMYGVGDVLPSGAHGCRIDPKAEVLSTLVGDEVIFAGDCRQSHDALEWNIGDVTRKRDGVGIILERVATPTQAPLSRR